jgi:hypothetical protein
VRVCVCVCVCARCVHGVAPGFTHTHTHTHTHANRRAHTHTRTQVPKLHDWYTSRQLSAAPCISCKNNLMVGFEPTPCQICGVVNRCSKCSQNTFSLPHVYANANVYILTHTCARAHLRFRERGLRSVSLALAFAAASVIQLPIAVRTL